MIVKKLTWKRIQTGLYRDEASRFQISRCTDDIGRPVAEVGYRWWVRDSQTCAEAHTHTLEEAKTRAGAWVANPDRRNANA